MRYSAVLSLLVCVAAAAPVGLAQQKGAFELSIYPLHVGTTWTYKAGSQLVKIEVERHELIELKKGKEPQKVLCARLLVSEGGRSLTEHVAVQSDGVYRYTTAHKEIAGNKELVANKEIVPPFCFLRMSDKATETWQAESSIDGTTIKAAFTRGVEEITLREVDINGQKVRNKRLLAVTSSCPEFQDGTQKRKIGVTCWFADGLGMVRQRLQMEGVDHVLELVEFKAGKGP